MYGSMTEKLVNDRFVISDMVLIASDQHAILVSQVLDTFVLGLFFIYKYTCKLQVIHYHTSHVCISALAILHASVISFECYSLQHIMALMSIE